MAAEVLPETPAKFEVRLAWDGINESDRQRILGSDPLKLEPEPHWAPILRDLFQFLSDSAESQHVSAEKSVTPFAHALLPVVSFGMRLLANRAPAASLPNTVTQCLRANLLDRIASVTALTLGEEFLRFRTARGWCTDRAPVRLSSILPSPPSSHKAAWPTFSPVTRSSHGSSPSHCTTGWPT